MLRVRTFVLPAIVVGLLAAPSTAAAQETLRLDALPLLSDAYPRAFFFRQSEGLASNPGVSYEQWEAIFLPLDGIMGKCLDEEIPGRSATNVEKFTRFKERNPDKAVLLHFNGNSRDPRFETEPYFAGHWLYHNGCGLTQDVPAEEGESILHVENPALFRVNMGRFDDKNEDLAVCLLDEQGRPDWSRAEQVQLLAIDPEAKTLRVRRATFGTTPRAFPAGKSYVAAHVTEGPWGNRCNLLWAYNFAITCPKDADDRTCADRLLDDLCRWFGEGGPLSAFDGIEFDVLHFFPTGARGKGADVNADGVADRGVVDGINVYGMGVHGFLQRLRERLGDNRLIMADGHGPRHQRSVVDLNGIESEGWPTLSDLQLADWSGGLNRHSFWNANARPPRLSYINHKFLERGEPAAVPMNITRLVLAAAHFTDSAFTYSLTPPRGKGQRIDVWDELRLGVEGMTRWLGRPLGPTRRLGFDGPDTLEDAGCEMRPAFVARWTANDARLETNDAELRIEGIDSAQDQMHVFLPEVDVPAGDVLVRCTVRAEPDADLGPTAPRLLRLGCHGAGALITSDLPEAAFAVRGQGEEPVQQGEPGAALVHRAQMAIGEEKHGAYLSHPPYGRTQGPGYTVWQRDVTVPSDGPALEFYTGLNAAPNPSDGVVFSVALVHEGESHGLFECAHTAYEWQHHRIDLANWAGKGVTLRFLADCGPADNSTADHAYWGDVVVRGPHRPYQRGANTPESIMTWANGTAFEASFYFRDAGPATVDLTLNIEGTEPVYISDFRIHSASDAMAREFEGGVVLANPSNHDHTFDVKRLFPGRSLRRIQGVASQDPKTNNGSVVSETVTLGPLDALFLAGKRGGIE